MEDENNNKAPKLSARYFLLAQCFLPGYLFHQARCFSYSPLHGFVCTSIFLTRLAIPEFLTVLSKPAPNQTGWKSSK